MVSKNNNYPPPSHTVYQHILLTRMVWYYQHISSIRIINILSYQISSHNTLSTPHYPTLLSHPLITPTPQAIILVWEKEGFGLVAARNNVSLSPECFYVNPRSSCWMKRRVHWTQRVSPRYDNDVITLVLVVSWCLLWYLYLSLFLSLSLSLSHFVCMNLLINNNDDYSVHDDNDDDYDNDANTYDDVWLW